MIYLKSFLFQALLVFLANYLIPGVSIQEQTKLPDIRGDVIFALLLGLCNWFLNLSLKMRKQETSFLKLLVCALILNFAAYGIVRFLPLQVVTETVEGYLCVALAVSVGSVLISFFSSSKPKPVQVTSSIQPREPLNKSEPTP